MHLVGFIISRNFLLFRPAGCIVFSAKETFVFQKILSLGILCRSVVNRCQTEAMCLSEPLVCRYVRCHILEDRKFDIRRENVRSRLCC